ncbi:MAG TPA: hypothetical protein VFT64_09555 [Rickettsiales bacterium]|nr:hypothetical protein [Rickettsiales bacterium]
MCAATEKDKEAACSGKCMGGCSKGGNRRWIIAACDGHIALLQQKDGGLVQIAPEQITVFTSVQAFWQVMDKAVRSNEVDQIIIVGSEGNIAWVQLLLPPDALKRVVAEIRYPLMTRWLEPSSDPEMLVKVLELVLNA